MDGKYTLNDLATMTGFTTRTLRNYLNQGLLKGEKSDGVWQFGARDVEAFFAHPFIKEGIRIKRNSVVYDFLADRKKQTARTCAVLDVPATLAQSSALSDFFCRQMQSASDTVFCFDRDNGVCRVILSGAADQVARIMAAYHDREKTD